MELTIQRRTCKPEVFPICQNDGSDQSDGKYISNNNGVIIPTKSPLDDSAGIYPQDYDDGDEKE